VLSQAGQILVQLADNAMVGRLGAAPLAGVAFGGTVFWSMFILALGITLGLTPLVGEMFAKREYRVCASYLQNSLLFYVSAGIVMQLLFIAAIPLMHLLGQPEEVVTQAIPYYKYLIWSVVPFMIYASFKQFLEGVGNTVAAMIVVISANAINIFLNFIFIYGSWGFPEMGAAGAGLATLISRGLMPIMLLTYFLSRYKYRRYLSFFSWKAFDFKWIRKLLNVGAPIAGQMFMENGAFVITSIMMGWLGTEAIAANQIATVVTNFAFMTIIGITSATTIRVSHEYGRGNFRLIKQAANASYHICMAWNITVAILFVVFRNQIPLLFTDDPEVVRIASMLMLFVAAFQLSDGLQANSISILRGLQDVKITAKIAFLSYIVINVPVGYVCAFVLGWGPGGLWVGFIVGLTTAAILLIARYRKKIREYMRKS
jgi:MATE family multidrug resistance protein